MTTTKLTTTSEFYVWAQAQLARPGSANITWKLNDGVHHAAVIGADGEPVMEEYTRYDGTVEHYQKTTPVKTWRLENNLSDRGYYRRSNDVYIPAEIGEALNAVWKRSQYDQFVGTRKLTPILAILDKNLAKDVVAKAKAARKAAEEETAKNLRNSARVALADKAQELLELVGKWSYGERAGLRTTPEEIAQMTVADFLNLRNDIEA